ncbi:uncharacterized protein LOC135344467 [Halichondria panicea]|uniref:uncharacterized protein LOC135344467 n=1 Tax=Halichondria panicea TaxID=6063 RepID=UPI00312B5CD5
MSESCDEESCEEAVKTTPGIVYLSRVPPFMKPHKVRHLLSPYGSVGRVYLQPEEDIVRQRRIKFRGNKKVKFTEGWVEFLDKRVAKVVATTLNCTPVGRKKRSIYHDDLWNIKYLPKFRWTHLTEKIAYTQAVREQKMRTEMSQVKRETSAYLSSVDKGKEITAITQRKSRQGVQTISTQQRHYKQRVVSEGAAASASGLCDSLLSKVFGR